MSWCLFFLQFTRPRWFLISRIHLYFRGSSASSISENSRKSFHLEQLLFTGEAYRTAPQLFALQSHGWNKSLKFKWKPSMYSLIQSFSHTIIQSFRFLIIYLFVCSFNIRTSPELAWGVDKVALTRCRFYISHNKPIFYKR